MGMSVARNINAQIQYCIGIREENSRRREWEQAKRLREKTEEWKKDQALRGLEPNLQGPINQINGVWHIPNLKYLSLCPIEADIPVYIQETGRTLVRLNQGDAWIYESLVK